MEIIILCVLESWVSSLFSTEFKFAEESLLFGNNHFVLLAFYYVRIDGKSMLIK
jgi:hypothetical protein